MTAKKACAIVRPSETGEKFLIRDPLTMSRRLIHTARAPNGLTYRSIVQLGKLLGPLSQQIDMTELAVSYFRAQAALHAKGPHVFVREVKARHKVPSANADLGALDLTPRLYVLQGVSTVSEFAASFRAEFVLLQSSRPAWRTQIDGHNLSALAQLRRNLPESGGLSSAAGIVAFALLEYYRECRNAYLHQLSLDDAAAAHTKLMLAHSKALLATFHRLPSPPNQLNHGDYVLLARALIGLAQQLNESCAITTAQVAEAILAERATYEALKKSRDNPARLRRKVAGYAASNFWATRTAAQEVASVVAKAVEHRSAREGKRAGKRL